MTGETTPDLKGMGDQLAENLERVGSAVSTPVKGSNGSGKVSETSELVVSLKRFYISPVTDPFRCGSLSEYTGFGKEEGQETMICHLGRAIVRRVARRLDSPDRSFPQSVFTHPGPYGFDYKIMFYGLFLR